MALLIPVISGSVSCTSLNTYGSQRLSPSVLFFVDFLMPFPKTVRLFVSVRQESQGFSLCQLSDIQPLSKLNSLELMGSNQGKKFPMFLLVLTSGPLHAYQVSEIGHL